MVMIIIIIYLNEGPLSMSLENGKADVVEEDNDCRIIIIFKIN